MTPLDLVTLLKPEAKDVSSLLQSTINFLELTDPGAREALEEAFLSIALRAIETKILSDKALRNLALYWNIYRGEADEIIESRIIDLFGVQPSKDLRIYIKNCIKSHSSREAGKEGISDFTVKNVLGSAVTNHPRQEVRCHYCGFHFRREDLSEKRQGFIEELAPVYARTIHPLRLEDKLKPWFTGNVSLTQLSIDHLTPEAGFGWTDPENLVIACTFCNQGKKIYRRPIEPISTIIAGSLQACPAGREHTPPRHIAIFSAISFKSFCSNCNKGVKDTELTVALPEENVDSRWLAPWVVNVTCYECLI